MPDSQPAMTGLQYLATRVANSDAAVAALMDENIALKAEIAELKAKSESTEPAKD